MSELLDRVLAAEKAVEDAGMYRAGRKLNFSNYAKGETCFQQLMAYGRRAPKYRNQEIWERCRKLGTSYLAASLEGTSENVKRQRKRRGKIRD